MGFGKWEFGKMGFGKVDFGKMGFGKVGFGKRGIWEEGYKTVGQGKWQCYYNTVLGYIRIGCMDKTIKDWDLFFESDKVIDTPRDTYEFFKIYQSYLVAKAAMEAETNMGDIN
jgi:hypothetical protein